MNSALEEFMKVPRTYNCAQSIAVGFHRSDLVPGLGDMGGGKAPEGRCGALYAALKICPEKNHAEICREFAAGTGSQFCRQIKQEFHFPCTQCVQLAAELVEKYKE